MRSRQQVRTAAEEVPSSLRWYGWRASIAPRRDVAQLGRALGSGPRGRGFESRHPDHPDSTAGRRDVACRSAISGGVRAGSWALLHGMGYGLCHQMPQRSFFGGGIQVPVCARDTGIYVGVLLSVLLISVLHRGSRPRGMPSMAAWVAMTLMVGAMAFDGVTEYLGMRATTNELRLITGLLAGFAIGALVTPMVNDELWRTSCA